MNISKKSRINPERFFNYSKNELVQCGPIVLRALFKASLLKKEKDPDWNRNQHKLRSRVLSAISIIKCSKEEQQRYSARKNQQRYLRAKNSKQG